MNNYSFSDKTLFVFIFLIVFSFFSCKKEKHIIKTKSGLSITILKKSKIGTSISAGSIVEFSVQYFTTKDSLLFNSDDISNKFRMKIDSADFGGKPSFNDAILALETGDSAQFYLNGVDFFTLTMKESIPTFLNPTDSVKFIVKIKKILSKAEYAAEMKRDAERREEREKDIRDQYLDRENITQKPNISGLIVIPLKQGKGRKILTGEIAQVQFLGSFINGKVFDSTSDDKPAEFVLGSPDVIPAWNEAVAGMSVGDKIQIIVPSQLAYGKDGLDDLIPPYSTLIYVIELKSIKK